MQLNQIIVRIRFYILLKQGFLMKNKLSKTQLKNASVIFVAKGKTNLAVRHKRNF